MLTQKLIQPVADRLMGAITALATESSTKPIARSKAAAKNGTIATNCKVVDVVHGRVLENSSVLIRGNVIQGIRQDTAIPAGREEVLDLGGRYLIPGLIDAHCHISVSSTFSILPTIGDAVRNYRQIRRQWATSIESGVTTVRDTGSFPLMRKGLEQEVEKGGLKGPRVFHCNSILNVKGSHPDIPPHHINPLAAPASLVMGSIGTDFRSDEELSRALEKNLPQASFIKLTVDRLSMLHGKGEIPAYSDRQLRTIFDFAEAHGLRVACHCGTSWGLSRMLDYPVHSLEHVVSDIPLLDKVIQAMADRNVSVVPTMSVGSAYVVNGILAHIRDEWLNDFVRNEIEMTNTYLKNVPESHCDPKIHAASLKRMVLYGKHPGEHLLKRRKYIPEAANFVRVLTTGVKNLLKMRDAGVNVGCGMDAGMPLCYFGALHREIGLLGRIGFTNLQALQAATINGARIIGAADTLGSIEQGKLADLVVLDQNPLEDLSALEKPVLVMKDGQVEHTLLNQGNGKRLDRI